MNEREMNIARLRGEIRGLLLGSIMGDKMPPQVAYIRGILQSLQGSNSYTYDAAWVRMHDERIKTLLDSLRYNHEFQHTFVELSKNFGELLTQTTNKE